LSFYSPSKLCFTHDASVMPNSPSQVVEHLAWHADRVGRRRLKREAEPIVITSAPAHKRARRESSRKTNRSSCDRVGGPLNRPCAAVCSSVKNSTGIA
jgi:hypothetical protein